MTTDPRPTPAEVEAALAVIQDAEGVTWTSGVDTDAIRDALDTIRAALAERDTLAAEVKRLRVERNILTDGIIRIAETVNSTNAALKANDAKYNDDDALADRDALAATNARLRDALQKAAAFVAAVEHAILLEPESNAVWGSGRYSLPIDVRHKWETAYHAIRAAQDASADAGEE